MKKVFLVFAVLGTMVACNPKQATEEGNTTPEEVVVEEVVEADSTQVSDSATAVVEEVVEAVAE